MKLLLNGSISALGQLATSVDYDDFARSEQTRLPISPAAKIPEEKLRGSANDRLAAIKVMQEAV